MKKLIGLCAFFTLLLIACRKETPLELPAGFSETPATCGNGIMDGNEDGIDCGTTTCTPCNLSHPIMCSGEFTDNELWISGAITNFDANEVTSSTASGHLVIEANDGTRILRVTFQSTEPEVFRPYECDDYPTPNAESAYVQYIAPGYSNHTAYSSEVHLNRENGKYTVEICDAYMGGSGAPYIIAKTRLLSSN